MLTVHSLRFRAVVAWAMFTAAALALAGCSRSSKPTTGGGQRTPESSDATYHILALDKEGKLKTPDKLQALVGEAKNSGVTDIFIMAHGWNNSSSDAQTSYRERLQKAREASLAYPALSPNPFKPMVIGLIWPSKAWDDGPTSESAVPGSPITPDLIAALEESFPATAAVPSAERADDVKTITQLLHKEGKQTTLEDRQKAYPLFRKYAIPRTKLKYPTPDDSNGFDGPTPEGASLLPESVFPSIADVGTGVHILANEEASRDRR